MTSRSLPKLLFAVIFFFASPVDVSAQIVDPCPSHQSSWTPTPEELIKFKTGPRKNRPNFCKADLSSANLADATLSSANLSGVNLSGAHLSDANLSGANTIGADLSGAELFNVNLKDTKIAYATLGNAIYDPVSEPPNKGRGSEIGLVQLRDLLQKSRRAQTYIRS